MSSEDPASSEFQNISLLEDNEMEGLFGRQKESERDPGSRKAKQWPTLDESDPRLGWVYRLNRQQLIEQLGVVNESTTGNVRTLRQRLVSYMRRKFIPVHETTSAEKKTSQTQEEENLNSQNRWQSQMSSYPNRELKDEFTDRHHVDQASICNKVRKWNHVFSGTQEPVSYLERLQELQEAYGVHGSQLLYALPELLTGQASLWARNNKQGWRKWSDFIRAFQDRYFPTSYLEELDADILSRRQKERESADEYVEDLRTLIRRRGGYSEREELNRLYKNLRPDIKLYVRISEVEGVEDLLITCREYEKIREEEKRLRSGKTTSNNPTGVATRNQRAAYLESNTLGQAQTDSAGMKPQVICWGCKKQGHVRRECPAAKAYCHTCKGPRETCGCGQGSSQESRKFRQETTATIEKVCHFSHPKSNNGDKRLFLPFKVGTREGWALLDTGAEESYVSEKVVKAGRDAGVVQDCETRHKVVLADGTPARLRGDVKITVHLKGEPVTLRASVMENLRGDFVMGLNNMAYLNLTINTRERKISWNLRKAIKIGELAPLKGRSDSLEVKTQDHHKELLSRQAGLPNRPKHQTGCATIQNLGRDGRLYVPMKIGETQWSALLDTGAENTYLSEHVTRQAREEINVQDMGISHQPHLVDGSAAHAAGEVKLKTRINGSDVRLRTTIIENMQVNCILGIKAMACLGLIIHAKTGQIEQIAPRSRWQQRRRGRAWWRRKKTVACVEGKGQDVFNSFLKQELELSKDAPGRTHLVKHVIRLKEGVEPIRQKPYPRNPAMQSIINAEVDKMLQEGVIEPSSSPWSSPIVLVRKNNGKYRFCVDLRKVNEVTHRDAYPLPNMTSILDKLKDAKFISTIDLKNGYWQVPLSKESKAITAFTVPGKGLFQFKVMPFGLHSAPATFQRLLDQVIGPRMEPVAFAYLDDLIVLGSTLEEHMHNLREVFRRLREAGLVINHEKCQFLQKQLRYLGHIVSDQGLHTDPDTVKAVQEFPRPQKIRSLRSFLGLASWYRRFVPDFATIAAPLHHLLKKGVRWRWGEQEEEAWEKLKEALIHSPVLTYPRFELPFALQADASGLGLGAALTQEINGEEKVIAYASRALRGPELNYSTTEKECLAVIFGLRKFKPYIEGYHVVVITDHQSLKWLRNIPNPTGRIARWIMEMQQYDLEIRYRKGNQHTVPDALSRNTKVTEVGACELDYSEQEDAWINKVKRGIDTNPAKYPDFTVKGERLYRHIWPRRVPRASTEEDEWKLCVPRHLRGQVIGDNHSTPSAGHPGIYKTYVKIARLYYWPGMFKDIAKYIRSCDLCQQYKVEQRAPFGPMNQARSVTKPWTTVSSDIIGPLPRSKRGNKYLVVFQDVFSKWVEVVPLKRADGRLVMEAFKARVITRFGTPRFLITDNGKQYVGKIMKKLCSEFHISQIFTPPYSPQGNPTERVNRVIKTLIGMYVGQQHADWDKNVDYLCFALNTTVHSATKYTPAFLNFGREPRTPEDWRMEPEEGVAQMEDEVDSTSRQHRLQVLHKVRQLVIDNLDEAYRNTSRHYNLRRRPFLLKAGDWVMKREYHLSSAAQNFAAKLAPKYSGPCKIREVISPNVLLLGTQDGKVLRCHVKDVKPYHGSRSLSN